MSAAGMPDRRAARNRECPGGGFWPTAGTPGGSQGNGELRQTNHRESPHLLIPFRTHSPKRSGGPTETAPGKRRAPDSIGGGRYPIPRGDHPPTVSLLFSRDLSCVYEFQPSD